MAAVGGAVYLFGLGWLTGVTAERIRFDGERRR
jgi:hypothetical protein